MALAAGLQVIGFVDSFVSLVGFLEDFLAPPEASKDATIVRIALGSSTNEEASFGGNTPGVSLWDFIGNAIGSVDGTSKILHQGTFVEVVIEPREEVGNIPANYMSISNGGNDAICIAGIGITYASGANAGFSTNVAATCGATWSFSNTPVLGNVSTGEVEPPKCVWIDRDGSNGIPHQGMGFHIPSFSDTNVNLARTYDENKALMCQSGPRFRMYPKLRTEDSILIFPSPPEFLRGVENKSMIGTDKDPSFIIDNPGKLADPLRRRRRDITTRRLGHQNSANFDNTTIVNGVNQTQVPARRPLADLLVISPSVRASARELCESPTSYGRSFVSLPDNLFCDMIDKSLYYTCSNKVTSCCLDTDTASFRACETNSSLSSALTQRPIGLPKSSATYEHVREMHKAKGLHLDDSRLIIHFDYDCFYASVVEAENPALKSVPLAIQQKQIVVTCNYEARRLGLRKLQLITEARKVCPEVVIVLGEDLTKFRAASKELYDFLRSRIWSHRAERLGFDEVWLDCTDMVEYNLRLLNPNNLAASFFCLDMDDPTKGFDFDATAPFGPTCPKQMAEGINASLQDDDGELRLRVVLGSHLARYLRHELESQKGYTATVGIAPNKTLAKLVGNVHKPRNQTTIMPPYGHLGYSTSTVTDFMDGHEIGQVPGIGFKIAQRLRARILGQTPDDVQEGEEEVPMYVVRQPLTVGQLRTHPGMGPEMLQDILGGAGSQKGIGEKIWGLLHGIDHSEVAKAKLVPSQISQEDSYRRYLRTFDQVKEQLYLLSLRLIRRMHLDLLEDDPECEGQEPVRKRWLAHPRTLRLSTRPRPPPGADSSRPRAIHRISRSVPLPMFVFSLRQDPESLAANLVEGTLVDMFRKLHPEKGGWNLSLINIAVTNMAETASDSATSDGRDIGRMFRQQEHVLKDFRIRDEDDQELTDAPPVVPGRPAEIDFRSAAFHSGLPDMLGPVKPVPTPCPYLDHVTSVASVSSQYTTALSTSTLMPASKRPKLSLQTSSLQTSHGMSTSTSASNRIDDMATVTPTTLNTFNNTFDLAVRPSPTSASPSPVTFPRSKSNAPSPFRWRAPYDLKNLPYDVKPILKNSALVYEPRRGSVAASASPRGTRKVFFPPEKTVSFAAMDEEIVTQVYVARHIDLSSSEDESSSTSSADLNTERARARVRRDDGSSDKAAAPLHADDTAPVDQTQDSPFSHRRSRKRRRWEWTIEDEASTVECQPIDQQPIAIAIPSDLPSLSDEDSAEFATPSSAGSELSTPSEAKDIEIVNKVDLLDSSTSPRDEPPGMGRERQKRKNRSSIPKSRPKDSKRTKTGHRKVDFGHNAIIAANWDRKLTLWQNYNRLGLSSKLGGPTGGTEKKGKDKDQAATNIRTGDSLAIPKARETGKVQAQEIQVERDPETGRIIRVLRPETDEDHGADDNPLNDPLNDILDEPQQGSSAPVKGVIAELEREAAREAEAVAKRRPRQQSQREEEWLSRLVAKYGQDTRAMARDRKLNPMQQTEGDLKRRLRKYNQKHAIAD
ncbi:hypothetical protein DV738_g406, partial [Chaetothyriales sp. CBS 135597]